MSCCSELVTIDCFDFCSTISLGYNADVTGVHTLEILIRGNSWQTHSITYTNGVDMTIPSGLLNEAKSHDIRIKRPAGTYFEFTTGVDCARLITGIYAEIVT